MKAPLVLPHNVPAHGMDEPGGAKDQRQPKLGGLGQGFSLPVTIQTPANYLTINMPKPVILIGDWKISCIATNDELVATWCNLANAGCSPHL